MDLSTFISDLIDKLSHMPGPVVYCTIVGVLLACGLGLPMPEDITLIGAGLLASAGRISFTGALIAGFSGVLIGDMFLFFLGRKFGKRVFGLPGIRRFFTPERILAAEARIRKHGPFICFIARFLPGLRSAVFAMSGALGVRFVTFLALDGLAAVLSVPLWVYVGYWFGNNFDDALTAAMDKAEEVQTYIIVALFVLIFLYIGVKLLRRRKRQRDLPVAGGSMAPAISDFESRE